MTARRRGSKVLSGAQLVLSTNGRDGLIDPLLSGSVVLEPVPNHLRAVVLITPPGVRTTARALSVVLGDYRKRGVPEPLKERDVLALPACLWCTLPRYASLLCLESYSALPACITNSRAVWTSARRLRLAVFGTSEWPLLVSSFESERCTPHDFSLWCEYKRKSPTWKLTQRESLGLLPKHNVAPPRPDTSVGDVLRGFGAELAAVSFDNEVPQLEIP